MNLKEKKAFAEKLDNVYCGILSNYPDFKDGEKNERRTDKQEKPD